MIQNEFKISSKCFSNIFESQLKKNGFPRLQYSSYRGWPKFKRPLEYLTGYRGRGKRWNLFSMVPLYVPGARPGWQGLETMEERGEQLTGKGRAMEERDERERKERDEHQREKGRTLAEREERDEK